MVTHSTPRLREAVVKIAIVEGIPAAAAASGYKCDTVSQWVRDAGETAAVPQTPPGTTDKAIADYAEIHGVKRTMAQFNVHTRRVYRALKWYNKKPAPARGTGRVTTHPELAKQELLPDLTTAQAALAHFPLEQAADDLTTLVASASAVLAKLTQRLQSDAREIVTIEGAKYYKSPTQSGFTLLPVDDC